MRSELAVSLRFLPQIAATHGFTTPSESATPTRTIWRTRAAGHGLIEAERNTVAARLLMLAAGDHESPGVRERGTTFVLMAFRKPWVESPEPWVEWPAA